MKLIIDTCFDLDREFSRWINVLNIVYKHGDTQAPQGDAENLEEKGVVDKKRRNCHVEQNAYCFGTIMDKIGLISTNQILTFENVRCTMRW